MRSPPVRAALVALAVVGSSGCTSEQALLPTVVPLRTNAPHIASLDVAPLSDLREDDAPLGRSRRSWLGIDFEIDADRPVAAWLDEHIRSALAEQGLRPASGVSHTAGAHAGRLEVALHRFDLQGSTWIRGRAVLDLSLERDGSEPTRDRIVVTTSDLVGEPGARAFTQMATKLARASSLEVTAWVRAAVERP